MTIPTISIDLGADQPIDLSIASAMPLGNGGLEAFAQNAKAAADFSAAVEAFQTAMASGEKTPVSASSATVAVASQTVVASAAIRSAAPVIDVPVATPETLKAVIETSRQIAPPVTTMPLENVPASSDTLKTVIEVVRQIRLHQATSSSLSAVIDEKRQIYAASAPVIEQRSLDLAFVGSVPTTPVSPAPVVEAPVAAAAQPQPQVMVAESVVAGPVPVAPVVEAPVAAAQPQPQVVAAEPVATGPVPVAPVVDVPVAAVQPQVAARSIPTKIETVSAEVKEGAPRVVAREKKIVYDGRIEAPIEVGEKPVVLQAAPITVEVPMSVGQVAREDVSVAAVSASAASKVEVATSAEVLIEAAEAVADTLTVSPGLLRGEGEVRVKLKPDVLQGTEIRIVVANGTLTVNFIPTVENMAVLLQACQPQLVAHLAERIHNFQIAVTVRRGEERLKG